MDILVIIGAAIIVGLFGAGLVASSAWGLYGPSLDRRLDQIVSGDLSHFVSGAKSIHTILRSSVFVVVVLTVLALVLIFWPITLTILAFFLTSLVMFGYGEYAGVVQYVGTLLAFLGFGAVVLKLVIPYLSGNQGIEWWHGAVVMVILLLTTALWMKFN